MQQSIILSLPSGGKKGLKQLETYPVQIGP
jgi:hypothetical protein